MVKQLSLNLTLHDNTKSRKSSAKAAADTKAAAEDDDDGRSAGRAAGNKHRIICRTVMRWLENTMPPTALALHVSTRNAKFSADIAAFWSESVRNPHEEGPQRILQPLNTMIVQCYTERRDCWPECTNSPELLAHLSQLKTKLLKCEERIRQQEPHLRDNNTLFSEYASWLYENSQNPEYHQLKRDIEHTEHALYRGTRFDQIRGSHLADRLYLAVPEGLVMPAELAKGWGLLWIDSRLDVREMVQPEHLGCIKENRLHLVQHIAAASKMDVLFHHGLVRRTAKSGIFMVQPPRGHRRPQPGLLS
jgi:hypothetical protein